MRTIAQISDLHFGRHSPVVAEALLTSLSECRPDLVAVSGDFTQRARTAEFVEAKRFLNRIPQPKLVVPGNHDVPFYNLLGRVLTPFAKYYRYVSSIGLPADFFGDEEIAVLGLNTARRFTGKGGRISVQQVAVIRQVFAQVPHRFKVLVTHHPLGFPSGEAGRELAGRSLLALEAAATAGIHLLLSGHYHRALGGHFEAELGCRNSILILHAGTAISTRIRSPDGNSYNLVSIDGARVSVTVMQWAAAHGFVALRTSSYVFQANRWLVCDS
jgi:3',5'-cyclic AMP phosphodiesterase CpdA